MKDTKIVSLIMISVLLISGLAVLGQSVDTRENEHTSNTNGLENGGSSKVDDITIEVRTNEETALGEVATRDLDVFLQSVSGQVYDSISDFWKDQMSTWESEGGYNSMYYNPAHTESPYECEIEGQMQFNPFAIDKIRRAQNWLMNRQKIIDDFYKGYAKSRFLWASKNSPVYEDYYKQIKEELGYTDTGNKSKGLNMIEEGMHEAMNDTALKGELSKGEDGYWEYKPPGGSWSDIEITGITRIEDKREMIGEYQAKLLNDCGFKVNNRKMDRQSYGEIIWSSDPADLQWQFYTGGWWSSSVTYYQENTPARMLAGWYGYMPGGFVSSADYRYGYWADGSKWNEKETGQEFYGNRTLEEITDKLFSGKVDSIDQYWQLMKKSTKIGAREAVRIFLVTMNEYYAYDKEEMINATTDTLTGWSDFFTPRTIETDDGTLTAAQYSSQGSLYMDNWNELGGSDDKDGLQQKRMCFDPSSALNPNNGKPLPFRMDWKDEDGNAMVEKNYSYEDERLIKNIDVPSDAVIYNSSGNKWENVGEGLDSAVKVTYDVVLGKWHSGTNITMADVMGWHAWSWDMSFEDGSDDPYFHQGFSEQMKPRLKSIVGEKWNEQNNTYTVWADYTLPIDSKIGKYLSFFPQLHYTQYMAVQNMINHGEFAPSNIGQYSWDYTADHWVHWLSESQGEDIKATLQNMMDANYVPWFMKSENNAPITVSQSELNAKRQDLIDFYDGHKHFYASQGPFMIEEVNPYNMYVDFVRFDQDQGYPYSKNYWSEYLARNKMPHADAGPDRTVAKGEKVIFSDDYSSSDFNYTWTIEGQKYESRVVEYIFENVGEYTVKLNESNGYGDYDTDICNITVTVDRTSPKADAGLDRQVYPGEKVSFDASRSTDNVGIVNYTWEIDGSVYHGEVVEKSFDQPGEYQAWLYVTDSEGNYDSDRVFIIVSDGGPPEAVAHPKNITIDEDHKVRFDASNSTDDYGIKNYTWIMDGSAYYGKKVEHIFNQPGNYSVYLKVVDFTDKYDTDKVEVNVRDTTAPNVSINVDKKIKEDKVITLDGSKSYDNVGISNYTWIIDGVKQYGKISNYEFEKPGRYDITLIATDFAGNSDSYSMTIIVTDVTDPVADAGEDKVIDEDTTATFNGSDSSDNVNITSYTWYIGEQEYKGIEVEHQFTTPGKYKVTLNVTDSSGNWDTDIVNVTVRDTTDPKADAGQDRTVEEDKSIEFNASGSTDNGEIISYVWTVEGETWDGKTFYYEFMDPGTYEVILNVTDKGENYDTDTVTITVLDTTDPKADGGQDRTVDQYEEVVFNASDSTDNVQITSYIWTIDGKEYSGKVVEHIFTEAGTYGIILNITDQEGNYDTDELTVTVEDVTKPTVSISGKTTVDEDISIKFNASSSSDNVGIVNYTWTIDGFELFGPEVSYTFDNPGSYTVELNVTDDAGNFNVTSVEVTVQDTSDPVADAGNDKTVSVNEEVTFDGSGSSDNVGIESYVWTIDGEEYTGEVVEHTFDHLGEYTVEITVTDNAGNSAKDSIAVTVEDNTAPTADAGSDITSGVDEEVTFNGSSSSDNIEIKSYVWTIDGSEYNGKEISHSFSKVGNYDVTLTVTDAGGNSDSDTITVTIEDDVPPTVSVNIYGELVVDKEITVDASESSDNVDISSIEWEFGDGATATGTNVTHTYDEAGDYTVNVTVTDEAGNTDEIQKSITIEKKDDGAGDTPGFTLMILLFSISLIALYRYKKKKR